MVMSSCILWDIICCFHLRGQRISPARNQRRAGRKQLCLSFYPEDGGDIFLQNEGWLSTDYAESYPRRQIHSKGVHVELKFIWYRHVCGYDITHVASVPQFEFESKV
jgi:hypothetical protein